MSVQSEAVRANVVNIGAGKCDLCKFFRADCVQWKTGWFSKATICDTCGAFLLREFDPNKRGDAE